MAGNLKRRLQNFADNPPKLRDTLAGNTSDASAGQVLAWDTNTEAFYLAQGGGGGGGAPSAASYLVIALDAGLSNERVLAVGSGLTFTDGGAGAALTLDTTGGGGGAPTSASYVVLAADQALTNERVLVAGAGLTLTDAGAGQSLTLDALASVEFVPVLSSATEVRKRDSIVVASAFGHAAADYLGTTTLVGVLASQQQHTTRARLFDVAAAAYVNGATLTTSSTSPTRVSSAALALATNATTYELHVDTVGASNDDDSSIVSSVSLRVG